MKRYFLFFFCLVCLFLFVFLFICGFLYCKLKFVVSHRIKLKRQRSARKLRRNFNEKLKPEKLIEEFIRKCRNIYLLANEKWEKLIVVNNLNLLYELMKKNVFG